MAKEYPAATSAFMTALGRQHVYKPVGPKMVFPYGHNPMDTGTVSKDNRTTRPKSKKKITSAFTKK